MDILGVDAAVRAVLRVAVDGGGVEQRLVGMQPRFRQVPPASRRSTTATFLPSFAARSAAS